jgi:endonuclease G, mitochondrial
MITQSEVRKARIEALLGAAERWQRRAPQRRNNERKLATAGPGAADSLDRQYRFASREAVRTAALASIDAGTLPIGLERRIGPSLDLIKYAPSDAARKAGRPVARIVIIPRPGFAAEGIATGFLIAPRLLLTNFHVFPSKPSARGLAANFLYEDTEQGTQLGHVFDLQPDDFFFSDRDLDFCIVAVSTKSSDGDTIEQFGAIPLIEATPKILIGQPVNIIQHPEGGAKRYATSDNRLVDILDEGFLHYSTDTLQGSSGAPAFNQMWELVALHHSGIPRVENGKIWSRNGIPWDANKMKDDEIDWIANEGIRVSFIVKKLSSLRMDTGQEQALLDALLKTTGDPLEAISNSVQQQPLIKTSKIEKSPMGTNVFNFSGPVTINVVSNAPVVQPLQPEPKALVAAQFVEAAIRFDRDYKNRKGYSENFLGIRVPIPTADKRKADLYKDANGKPIILKYHHYSLCMNEARRLQMWSAVNVDYSPARRDDRSRSDFGSDKWVRDPRVKPAEVQIIDEEFYKPATRIDRGHIVRREDSAWGNSADEIEFSNSDTYHWTNCTPQHELFNQETPSGYPGRRGVWGEFERYVEGQLLNGDKKCCILAGPVLMGDDPERDFEYGSIKYPLKFWKVIAVAKRVDGKLKLQTYGFVFDQTNVVDEFGIEFVPGRFRRNQVSLQEITDMTDVEFDAALLNADDKKQ